MGTVYKARHLLLDRDVVLKLLNSSAPNAAVRFHREAKVLSKLNHPNIAKVFDFGFSANNTPYLAIEYIEGKTLSQMLEDNGPFELEFALLVITQLAEALEHAHSIGIVHRDLKPSNVIIREANNEVVLLDFGIAKLSNESDVSQELTRTGVIVGSPPYMSPEQCASMEITATSDQYSLGCLFFEMLSGRPPFSGESALETILLQQHGDLPSLALVEPEFADIHLLEDFRETKEEVEKIIIRLLQKNPSDRFASMTDLKNKLTSLSGIGEKNTGLVPPPAVSRSGAGPGSTGLIPVVGSAIAIVALLIAAAVLFFPVPRTDKVPVQDMDPMKELKELIRSRLKEQVDGKDWHIDTSGKLDKVVEDEALVVLKNYSLAQSANFSGSGITDTGVANLSHSRILRLDLRGCWEINSLDNSVKQLLLQKIVLQNTPVDDTALRQLKSLRMLEELDLSRTQVTDEGLLSVLPAIPSLKTVMVRNEVSDRTLGVLSGLMPACHFFRAGDDDSEGDYVKFRSKLQDELVITAPDEKDRRRLWRKAIAAVARVQGNEAPWVAEFRIQIASSCRRSGNIHEGLKEAELAERACENSGNLTLLAQARMEKSLCVYALGKKTEALEQLLKGLPLFEETQCKNSATLLGAFHTTASIAAELGRRTELVDLCDRGSNLIACYYKNVDEQPKMMFFCEQAANAIRLDAGKNWKHDQMFFRERQSSYLLSLLINYKKGSVKTMSANRARVIGLYYGVTLAQIGHLLTNEEKRLAKYSEALDRMKLLRSSDPIDLTMHYCDIQWSLAQLRENHGDYTGSAAYWKVAFDKTQSFPAVKWSDNRDLLYAERLLAAYERTSQAKAEEIRSWILKRKSNNKVE